MARSNLAYIISFVRTIANDTGASPNFTDDEIQAFLDRHRWEASYLPLQALPTRTPSGVEYKTFVAPGAWQWWEDDAAVYDANYNALSFVSGQADYQNGRFEQTTAPDRPVTISGYSHDPYAAAADLLEARASQLSEDLQSFSTINGSFTYAKKYAGPSELAKRYRRMSRAYGVGVDLVREDAETAN